MFSLKGDNDARLNAINDGILEEGCQKVLNYCLHQLQNNCRTVVELPKDEQLGLYRFEIIVTDEQVKSIVRDSRGGIKR